MFLVSSSLNCDGAEISSHDICSGFLQNNFTDCNLKWSRKRHLHSFYVFKKYNFLTHKNVFYFCGLFLHCGSGCGCAAHIFCHFPRKNFLLLLIIDISVLDKSMLNFLYLWGNLCPWYLNVIQILTLVDSRFLI